MYRSARERERAREKKESEPETTRERGRRTHPCAVVCAEWSDVEVAVPRSHPHPPVDTNAQTQAH